MMELNEGIVYTAMICDEFGCDTRDTAQLPMQTPEGKTFEAMLASEPQTVFTPIYGLFEARGWVIGVSENGQPHAVCPKCRKRTMN